MSKKVSLFVVGFLELAIYKCSQKFEPGTTWNKFKECLERVLNPGSPDRRIARQAPSPLGCTCLGQVVPYWST